MLLKVKHGLDEAVALGAYGKNAFVEEVRQHAAEKLGAPHPSNVKLIYSGKFLEDGQRLLYYRLENEATIIVQIAPSKVTEEEASRDGEASIDGSVTDNNDTGEIEFEPADSIYFDLDQAAEVRDEDGSWHEAKIERICKSATESQQAMDDPNNDGLVYFCRYDRFPDQVDQVQLNRVRPRAVEKVVVSKATSEALSNENRPKVRYLVNYNIEKPGEMGDWYEAELDFNSSNTKTRMRHIKATVFAGNLSEVAAIPNCNITKLDEIFVLPERSPKAAMEQTNGELKSAQASAYPLRSFLDCRICWDNPALKPTCRYCMCAVCQNDRNNDKLLICEQCHEAHHTYCLTPPLTTVPDDDWYCPDCKIDDSEIVKAGETKKLMTSKLLNMPSSKSKRRWGGRHSCDGLAKKCSIVPSNHFGPIPGVEVGTCWRYQKQVAEAGVHRMLVAGIHGKESEGAYSIVIAGGYSDDVDEGDKISYTGSGGRDLSGNKRVSVQSSDQTLTRHNAALAMNCYSKSRKLQKNGGNAGADWRKGNPVRVVRSFKLRNKFAPAEGYRYDGIYKVVKYMPVKGKEGFIVWRYMLQRDDPTPAPWTKEGRNLIRSKGLDKIIELEDGNGNENGYASDDCSTNSSNSADQKSKRPRIAAYEIPRAEMKAIGKDVRNKQLWSECIAKAAMGYAAFVQKIAESFACVICTEIVHKPVTLDCGHTFCKSCIEKALETVREACPMCRQPLQDGIQTNQQLGDALQQLIPGYAKGRDGKKRKTNAKE